MGHAPLGRLLPAPPALALAGLLALCLPAPAAAPPHFSALVRRIEVVSPPAGGVVTALAFSPDGRSLAAWCNDIVVRVLDLPSGKVRHQLRGHSAATGVLAFSPDGTRLATADGDGVVNPEDAIRLWDVRTGKRTHTLKAHRGGFISLAFTADGRRLCSGGRDRRVMLWDLSAARAACLLPPSNKRGAVVAVAPSGPDEVVALTWSLSLERLSMAPGPPRESRSLAPPTPPKNWGWAIKGERGLFTPGGRGVVVQMMIEGVYGLPPGGKELVRLVAINLHGPGTQCFPSCVACDPSGRLVAVGTDEDTALAELGTGKLVALLPAEGMVSALAFSPCGRYLAVSNYNRPLRPTVQLWDLHRLGNAPPPPARTADQREQRWQELVGEEPLAAYRAMAALASCEGAVPLLRGKLIRPPVPQRRLDRLIAALDDDDFAVRRRAEGELAALEGEAEASLRRALVAGPSAEAALRLRRLLGRLSPGALWQRRGRAIDLLERIGSAEAAALLKELARRKGPHWEGVEAGEALQRLQRRLATEAKGVGAR